MNFAGEGSDKDVWWKTLKQLMEQEEKGNQSVLHYAVASTLLQYSTLLPAWLVNSYKVRIGPVLLFFPLGLSYIKKCFLYDLSI